MVVADGIMDYLLVDEVREAPGDQGGFLGHRAFGQFIYGGESLIWFVVLVRLVLCLMVEVTSG